MATMVLNKNETREYQRIKAFVTVEKDYAQRSADIWMRSAPTKEAKERRQAAVKTLGLVNEIQYL